MCAHHGTQGPKRYKLLFLYLLAISLGLYSGLGSVPFLESLGLMVSDVFIKIFKCISLPMISLSLIVTLSNLSRKGHMQSLWKRVLLYTLTTTLVAAALSCALYILIRPENVSAMSQTAAPVSQSSSSYFSHLQTLIPANLLSPFMEHQVMGVLLISLALGVAIRSIPEEKPREAISQVFKGAHSLFLVITNWVVKLIPLGLFGFITATAAQLKNGMELMGIGKYLLVIIGANLIQGFVLLPVWLKMKGIAPFKAMKGMLPALSLAFFSKSSTATLPVTMESAEKNLKITPEVSRFALPLCTTINMNGCAAFIFTTVIYLMQNHGLALSPMTMVAWIFIATAAAIGNAGVPMGCFFLSASLLASMDVPITLLGIILPFYSLIDMMETSLNVWSDSCVTKVADQKVREEKTESLLEETRLLKVLD